MRIAEAITKLQKIKRKYGNLLMVIHDSDAGRRLFTIRDISFSEEELSIDDFFENGASERVIKEFLPNFVEKHDFSAHVEIVNIVKLQVNETIKRIED
jgi:hypothetical protein